MDTAAFISNREARMSRSRLPLHLAAFILFTLPLTLARADEWPVPRSDSREPNPYKYNPKQWKSVPKEFLEDSSACLLYASTTNLVDPDGTVETVTHEITRLNGRKAIEKFGEFRHITYDPSYQKLTLNEARIFKKNGRLVAVEPRHAQLRDVSTDYLVYDRDKVLILSLPGLEVGDVFEAKWTVRGKNLEHGGRFFTRYAFGDPIYPVALDEFKVRVPTTMPFRYAVVGAKNEPSVTEDDDTRTYVWGARNNKPLPQDDNLPPRDELRQIVAVSTFASWEEVGKWKEKLRADCWVCNDELRKAVADITKNITDPAGKARALTYWLRRNVRYVSAGEKHDYTPHPPAQVYANRCGDCKDTSQMLAVMLREAGIPVELVTLGTHDDGQVLDDVPSPWGTHAILLATIDGKEHWIDTTSSLSGWDLLPRDDRDRRCYLVDDKGKIRLHRTPKLSIDDNRIEQTTHVWIGNDGATRCEREGLYHGLAAIGQRDALLETPVGERRRIITNELQDSNSRTHLLKLAVDEATLRDFDSPVKVRMTFEIPGQFNGSPDREGSLSDNKTWGRLLAFNLDYDREVAMQYYAPFELKHKYVIHLPPAYHLETVPREQALRCKWGSYTARVKTLGDVRGQTLEVTFHTRLENARIDPAGFDEFRQFHEDVSRSYRVWLTLKPVTELEDAGPLETLLALAPDDAESAATLAKLYLVNTRQADARRVLARACHYSPKSAVLWELAAAAAGNPADEEKAQRQLVRLFPDDSKHALRLGSILVDAGKHEAAAAVLEPLAEKSSPTNRAQAHYQLARSFYAQNEPDEALRHLKDAEAADDESVRTAKARVLLGRVNEKLGKTKDAAKAYEDALKIEKDSEEALDALIHLSLAANDRDEALTYLRRYTVLVGDDVSGQLLAADHYLRVGHYDEAFDLAARVRAKTFHEKAQRITGLVYLHRGEPAKAIQHLDKAEPDAVVAEALLRATLLLGNLDDVQKRLDQAERLRTSSEALKKTSGRARALLQRRDEVAKLTGAKSNEELQALGYAVSAEQSMKDGRSRTLADALLGLSFAGGVEVGPALALRGRLALDQGKLTKALEDAERAIVLCPQYPASYFVRGRVRLERQIEGGLADLEKAASLSERKDAEVLHTLADALFRLGRVKEAVATQREAAKLKPTDSEIAEQLRQFEKATGG
jgi:tetratricopeptide (TPR) repeat protein